MGVEADDLWRFGESLWFRPFGTRSILWKLDFLWLIVVLCWERLELEVAEAVGVRFGSEDGPEQITDRRENHIQTRQKVEESSYRDVATDLKNEHLTMVTWDLHSNGIWLGWHRPVDLSLINYVL